MIIINFRAYIDRLQANPSYSKIYEWSKLISITSFSQILVQGIGFISGIIVIRLLSLEEYAFYTLANIILGTMIILADAGISAGVYSQSGKVWKDKLKLGKVLSTGLHLRRKFSIISLIISLPLLIFLLKHNGASWLMAVLISITLIPAFLASLSSSILIIVPKIHQDVAPILKNDVEVGLGRLLLTTIFIFIFPFTFMALLANGIPRIYGNFKLKKIASSYLATQKPDPFVEKKLIKTVKRMFPGLVYYCLSGQIILWIISFLGNTTTLAQLGALGRIAVIFSFLIGLLRTLIIPRFARLPEDKKKLFKYYVQILSLLLPVIGVFIGMGYIFSNEILWVLGGKYSGLQIELLLILVGGAINLLSGTSYELNICRDWIINPTFSISLSIVATIMGALLLDISEFKGVLIFNIFLALIQMLANVLYGFFKILKSEKVFT